MSVQESVSPVQIFVPRQIQTANTFLKDEKKKKSNKEKIYNTSFSTMKTMFYWLITELFNR